MHYPPGPSIPSATLCPSDASGRPGHAQGRSQGDSDLPFGVAGKTAADRTCSISESGLEARAWHSVHSDVDDMAGATVACLAWQRRDQAAHTKPHVRRPTSGYLSVTRRGSKKLCSNKEDGVGYPFWKSLLFLVTCFCDERFKTFRSNNYASFSNIFCFSDRV